MAKKADPLVDVFRTTDKRNRHDENGHEVLNPTPVAPPLGYNPAPSLVEQIRQQVRAFKQLDDQEPETEEEADDFECEDDPLPTSRWENDMIPSIKETRARLRALEEQERLYANPRAAPAEGGAADTTAPASAAPPATIGAPEAPK